jgi:AcrR family transcriptional regulator
MTRRRDPGTKERLELLLQAALAEFAARSYEEASLNTILKNAGISKGIFYHYFTDKAGLYAALLRRLAEVKVKVFTEWAGDVMPRPEEDLFAYFERMLAMNAMIAAYDPLLYRFAVQFAREPADFRHRMQGGVAGAGDVTGQLVEHGLTTGTFDPTYPPEFVRGVFTYFVEHVFDLLPMEENVTPEAIERRMALLFRFLKDGLGA